MKIHIQTTQNVPLEYEIAGIGYRIIAALIDIAIFIGYVFFFVLSVNALGVDWSLGVSVALILPMLIYQPVCEIFLDGQSIGKKMMSLKVVKVDGSQPSTGDYLLRWLLWIIEANPVFGLIGLSCIGIVSIVVTQYGQRLGDLAAGTTVVRQTSRAVLEDTIFRPVGEEYTPALPQVTILSDRDVTIIRSGFDAVDMGADEALLDKIADRVADVLSVERGRIGAPRPFLKRVLTDYNYLSGQTAQP